MSAIERLANLANEADSILMEVAADLARADNKSVDSLRQRIQLLDQLSAIDRVWQPFTANFSKIYLAEKENIKTALRQIGEVISELKECVETPSYVKKPTLLKPVGGIPQTLTNPTHLNGNGAVAPPEVAPAKAISSSGVPSYSEMVVSTVPNKATNGKVKQHVKTLVAPGVYVEAYHIKEPRQCHSYPGWLCYCNKDCLFYLSINGDIYPAVTTKILPTHETPHKWFEHNDSKNIRDIKGSAYYVPRELNPESRDVRILTNRAIYVPSGQELRKNERYCYRIGDKDHLSTDLINMDDAEYRLLTDMAGNWLLCWMSAQCEKNNRKHVVTD